MMRIGVVGNRDYPELASFLDRLQDVAPSAGVTLIFEADLYELLPRAERMEAATAIDALITLGGDGTFLRGARALDGRDLPILGVNLGRLGFLTACGGDEAEEALQRFARGDYVAEDRMMLEAQLSRSGVSLESWFALNDVVLHSGGKARVIRLVVDANGERIASYAADGLILATPTGSSAYSLSSGGPIVHPELDSITLTPISAHTLTVRPLLLSPTTTVSLRVGDDESEQLITVDGQESAEFVHGDVLTVRRASRRVRLVRFPETTFFARMRHKLGWGGS
ncbi:MAG: NAD(+)/NADH kinase [Gemmatimonadaceae bacterium]